MLSQCNGDILSLHIEIKAVVAAVAREVTRRGRVRRAKLYYLRDRVGKATRIKEKR